MIVLKQVTSHGKPISLSSKLSEHAHDVLCDKQHVATQALEEAGTGCIEEGSKREKSGTREENLPQNERYPALSEPYDTAVGRYRSCAKMMSLGLKVGGVCIAGGGKQGGPHRGQHKAGGKGGYFTGKSGGGVRVLPHPGSCPFPPSGVPHPPSIL
eukprot:756179-Hanusia_phi.AAC.2